MYKRLGIFLIILMFIFSSGFVFAQNQFYQDDIYCISTKGRNISNFNLNSNSIDFEVSGFRSVDNFIGNIIPSISYNSKHPLFIIGVFSEDNVEYNRNETLISDAFISRKKAISNYNNLSNTYLKKKIDFTPNDRQGSLKISFDNINYIDDNNDFLTFYLIDHGGIGFGFLGKTKFSSSNYLNESNHDSHKCVISLKSIREKITASENLELIKNDNTCNQTYGRYFSNIDLTSNILKYNISGFTSGSTLLPSVSKRAYSNENPLYLIGVLSNSTDNIDSRVLESFRNKKKSLESFTYIIRNNNFKNNLSESFVFIDKITDSPNKRSILSKNYNFSELYSVDSYEYSYLSLYLVDHGGIDFSWFGSGYFSENDFLNIPHEDTHKCILNIKLANENETQDLPSDKEIDEEKAQDTSKDISDDETLKTTSQTSQTTQSQGNLSINFEKLVSNENFLCTEKVCYYKEWPDNFSLTIKLSKKFSDKEVYFAVNNLNKNYENVSISQISLPLSGNNILLGNNLNYKNFGNGPLNVTKPSDPGNFVITAMQDGTPEKSHVFFVHMPEGFEKIVEYKTLQKIINDVYCKDCPIPDWLPFGLSISTPIQTVEVSTPGKPSDCIYSGDYFLLCFFNIFNLEMNIGSSSIPTSAGTMNPKETFYLEIKTFYDSKKSNFDENLEAYKLFLDEKENFGLNNNELTIYFAIIGGESSFSTKHLVGDQGNSFGLAQINASIWRTEKGYNDLKSYLPSEINTPQKYYIYFDDAKTDLYKSLYLGLAVFKFNLNYAKKNITSFSSNKYSDVDRAFIMFYAHQFNIIDAKTFFNTVNIQTEKDNVIINCSGTGNDLFQNSSLKKLGCVATVGSVRKLGWYLFGGDNLPIHVGAK